MKILTFRNDRQKLLVIFTPISLGIQELSPFFKVAHIRNIDSFLGKLVISSLLILKNNFTVCAEIKVHQPKLIRIKVIIIKVNVTIIQKVGFHQGQRSLFLKIEWHYQGKVAHNTCYKLRDLCFFLLILDATTEEKQLQT